MSWAVVDVDSGTDRVDTSTTDPSFDGGAVTGPGLGCTEAGVLEPGASAMTSLLDGALSTVRFFGFFGVDAAADGSEPDFLSLIVAAADFLPVPLLLRFATPSSAVLSLPSVVDSAASSPDGPDDWEDPSVLDDDEDDPFDESELEDEEVLDEEDESDDESDDELEESVSDGPAQATPGVVATATPTPKATAKPPTRPMYLA